VQRVSDSISFSPAAAPYEGRAGQTRKERVHMVEADGSVRTVEVYRTVNVVTHPELKRRVLEGALHRLSDGRELALPFVYHDPSARKLALVIPTALAHLEMKEWSRLMAEVSEDTEHAVPTYVREGTTVLGLGALALFLGEPLAGVALESSLSEPPNLAQLAAREHQSVEKEQKVGTREKRVVEREQQLAAREEQLVVRERQLAERVKELETAVQDGARQRAELTERLKQFEAEQKQLAHGRGAFESEQKQVAQKKKELDAEQKRLGQLKKEVESQQQQHAQALQQHAQAELQIAHAEKQLALSRQEIDAQERRSVATRADLDRRAQQLLSERARLDERERELLALQARLSERTLAGEPSTPFADAMAEDDAATTMSRPSERESVVPAAPAAQPMRASQRPEAYREPTRQLYGETGRAPSLAAPAPAPASLRPQSSPSMAPARRPSVPPAAIEGGVHDTALASSGALRKALGDPARRLDAIRELCRRGHPNAIAPIFGVLSSLSPEEVSAAVVCLLALGDGVVEGLAECLANPSQDVRQAAALGLGQLRAGQALPALVHRILLESTPSWEEMARALGDFGAEALPHVVAALPSSERRERLMLGLSHLANHGCLEEVKSLESSPDTTVAGAARQALVRCARLYADDIAVRTQQPLRDQSPETRFSQVFFAALARGV